MKEVRIRHLKFHSRTHTRFHFSKEEYNEAGVDFSAVALELPQTIYLKRIVRVLMIFQRFLYVLL